MTLASRAAGSSISLLGQRSPSVPYIIDVSHHFCSSAQSPMTLASRAAESSISLLGQRSPSVPYIIDCLEPNALGIHISFIQIRPVTDLPRGSGSHFAKYRPIYQFCRHVAPYRIAPRLAASNSWRYQIISTEEVVITRVTCGLNSPLADLLKASIPLFVYSAPCPSAPVCRLLSSTLHGRRFRSDKCKQIHLSCWKHVKTDLLARPCLMVLFLSRRRFKFGAWDPIESWESSVRFRVKGKGSPSGFLPVSAPLSLRFVGSFDTLSYNPQKLTQSIECQSERVHCQQCAVVALPNAGREGETATKRGAIGETFPARAGAGAVAAVYQPIGSPDSATICRQQLTVSSWPPLSPARRGADRLIN
ncbi:hypothetical protein J6590_026756 [Homalodisca vitripennis]|nr:hypothetical protein J6590_026756 [Homalodisca vitripennis]